MNAQLILTIFYWLLPPCHQIIPDTLNDYKMVVTWGAPQQNVEPPAFEISWEECVQKCWADTSCVFIHDTSPTCEYFYIQNIPPIDKLPRSSHNRVAFRVLMRNRTCTWREEEPLLLDGTVQSDVQRSKPFSADNSYIPINITLANEVWTFTQKDQAYMCPNNHVPVRRGATIWCLQVMTSDSCLNKTEANNACIKHFNKSLAGIANREEYELVKTNAMNYLSNPSPYLPSGYKGFGFWIDGVRKPTCTSLAQCNGTNEFAYSDTYAQNPVLDWNPGQPDGLAKNTKDDCVAFIAKQGQSGVEDVACGKAEQSTTKLCMVGFYCGKELGPDGWGWI